MNGNERLELEGVAVCYASAPILQNISLSVPRGAWVSIIGPNGAGKSTLLKAIMGIAECSAGTIRWNGVDMTAVSQRERARSFSYVPQQFSIEVGFTVEEFLTLSRYAADPADAGSVVSEVLAQFGLHHLSARSATTLSAGEMQRVLVASALIQGADVILMDEPAAFLDPGQERDVMETLAHIRLEQQKTVLSVTHDISNAFELGDICVVMNRGAIAFVGSAQELRRNEVLREVFGRSFIFIEAPEVARLIVVPQ